MQKIVILIFVDDMQIYCISMDPNSLLTILPVNIVLLTESVKSIEMGTGIFLFDIFLISDTMRIYSYSL